MKEGEAVEGETIRRSYLSQQMTRRLLDWKYKIMEGGVRTIV